MRLSRNLAVVTVITRWRTSWEPINCVAERSPTVSTGDHHNVSWVVAIAVHFVDQDESASIISAAHGRRSVSVVRCNLDGSV